MVLNHSANTKSRRNVAREVNPIDYGVESVRNRMVKALLFLPLLFCALSLHAQTTTIVTVPNGPIIKFCAHPANAVPCSNLATTYTDATLSVACPSSAQIVLDGTNNCVSSPNAQGRWGVWVGPGAYDYTVTVGGTNYGPFYLTAQCNSTGCTLTSPVLTSPIISNPTTTGTDAGAETLSNKTLTSPAINTPTITTPILNGTPTGTGIPTVTLKKGSGLGNYTTTGDSNFHDVDAVNLAYTVTIPIGWKLAISAFVEIQVSAGAAGVAGINLLDGTELVEAASGPGSALSVSFPTTLNWVITGDGNSHTIKMQFKTFTGTNTALILNGGTRAPAMLFILTPSN